MAFHVTFCPAIFGVLFIAGGCCCWLFDVAPSRGMSTSDPDTDFRELSGCTVLNATRRKTKFCTAFCSSSKKPKQFGCDHYVDYSFVVGNTGTQHFDTIYLGRGSCNETKPWGASPKAEQAVRCWQSAVDPVPSWYRCGCTSWIKSQCKPVTGVCLTMRNPGQTLFEEVEAVRPSFILAIVFWSLGTLGVITTVVLQAIRKRQRSAPAPGNEVARAEGKEGNA